MFPPTFKIDGHALLFGLHQDIPITPQLVEWQLFESNNCRFLKLDVQHLFDKMKNLVFKVSSDKSQQKIW